MNAKLRALREAVESKEDSKEEGVEYVTKIIVEGTRTVEDDTESIVTTTLSAMEKGKAHLAKIEDTIHTISDKTKGKCHSLISTTCIGDYFYFNLMLVPTWGVVLAVISVLIVVLLLLGLIGWKLFKKFAGKDSKLGKSMLGNSMQLLRGSFKDKAS